MIDEINRAEEYWLCKSPKKPEDYRKEIAIEEQYRFPFLVTMWKDKGIRIIIK